MRGVRFFGDGIAHQLGDHAEPAAPDPVHRQHSRAPGHQTSRSSSDESQSRDPQSAMRSALRSRPAVPRWRRNVVAVTAASFMGYTGFTLVMPFLPLFIGQLGVTDVGADRDVDRAEPRRSRPALTALLAPAWGRLGDRFGRKIMVERSLVSFVVLFAAMAFVTRVVARARAARRAGAVRGLRVAVGGDGRRVGAARPHAVGDRRRADRAAHRPGARPADRRRPRAGRRAAARRSSRPRCSTPAALVLVHVLYDDRADPHAAGGGRGRDRPRDVPQRAGVPGISS